MTDLRELNYEEIAPDLYAGWEDDTLVLATPPGDRYLSIRLDSKDRLSLEQFIGKNEIKAFENEK